ncbi:efflux RND transporter periplasmic adaptor subunit [Marinobacterium marinum]|uniref:Efflux RND transporter periplasmic adaptor subunit n=1 Tax=Marinobacterium marinum TaxID=2756129 RepID=A0A7W1WXS2_9GAMM|nr:efflux RND transporter periplasmic adaptor subunit [Marinobacterium marinum]MBA4502194.1 efflux RND transporter periplasmic adaptor subunit [Marinobacterium marinum]
MKKGILIICLAGLLASQTVLAEDSQAAGLPAEVVRVQPSTLEHSLTAIGVLQANETVMIRPEQSGRISEILFTEGEQINANSPLFKLDSALYDAALAQAQARARLSKLEYERAASLLEKRVGSRTDHDAKMAQLRVDEAEVALARTRLEKMTIRAPFSGTAGLRLVSPGDFVAIGQDLVELTDMSTLKVEFSVPERDLQRLSNGQAITLNIDALGGQQVQGNIYAISPSANPNSHNISVRARVPNTEGLLRPGLFARVSITTERNDQALIVPEQALILQGAQTLIMQVTESNQVELVPVTTGSRRYGEVQILSGLEPGAVVVTAGHMKLHPGMPVTPIFPQPVAPEGNGA